MNFEYNPLGTLPERNPSESGAPKIIPGKNILVYHFGEDPEVPSDDVSTY